MKSSPAAHCLALFLLGAATPASAHISYTNRNFGTFSGGEAPVSLLNQSISGNYGWADGTDEDYGDSHRMRAYRFTLTYDATVTVEVAATSNNGALLGDLTPGFSIYGGLAHLPPAALDHDFATVSAAWLTSLGGVTKEGSFRALHDWKMGNDDGLTFADLSSFTFRGYAVDGTSANFGNAPGVTGDGLADGRVTGSFNLTAGDYTILVGGGSYLAEGTANRGANITLSVIPEPAAAGFGATVLGTLALRRRRRA